MSAPFSFLSEPIQEIRSVKLGVVPIFLFIMVC